MNSSKPADTAQESVASLDWLTPQTASGLIAGYALVAVIYGLVVWNIVGSMHAGLFGDMFGAFNAFVSGIAMLGVIAAILLQRQQNRMQAKELALQREELEATRRVLADQREELKTQNATFARQTFDNTFFQMLSLHHQIVNAIDLRDNVEKSQRIATGRDCFVTFYRQFGEHIHGFISETSDVQVGYLQFYERAQADIGHYFRNLYTIVKFIDQSELTEKDKKIFTNFVRAQLSSHELLMLFYNCLSPLGREKFKPLLEKYALLKNMPKDKLWSQSHVHFYEPSAFGSPPGSYQ